MRSWRGIDAGRRAGQGSSTLPSPCRTGWSGERHLHHGQPNLRCGWPRGATWKLPAPSGETHPVFAGCEPSGPCCVSTPPELSFELRALRAVRGKGAKKPSRGPAMIRGPGRRLVVHLVGSPSQAALSMFFQAAQTAQDLLGRSPRHPWQVQQAPGGRLNLPQWTSRPARGSCPPYQQHLGAGMATAGGAGGAGPKWCRTPIARPGSTHRRDQPRLRGRPTWCGPWSERMAERRRQARNSPPAAMRLRRIIPASKRLHISRRDAIARLTLLSGR